MLLLGNIPTAIAADATKRIRNRRLAVPTVGTARGSDGPRFELARQSDRCVRAGEVGKEGNQPSRAAEKLVLLRRVTYDLIGLPPTPEEQAAFLADTSADAYAKVVDRLLASPRYGERWAEHWLDVVRYAETDGFKND